MNKKLNNDIIETIKTILLQNNIKLHNNSINFNSDTDFYIVLDIEDINAYTHIKYFSESISQISKYHFLIFFSDIFKDTYKMSVNLNIHYINEVEYDEVSYQVLLSRSQIDEFRNILYEKYLDLNNKRYEPYFEEMINNITKYEYSNKVINNINDL